MPSTVQQSHKPMRRSDVCFQEVDGEVLIYDEQRSATFRLNTTAGFIWRCCDGSQNGEAIVDALTRVWNVTPGQARDDVFDVLEEFSRQQLIGWVRESQV